MKILRSRLPSQRSRVRVPGRVVDARGLRKRLEAKEKRERAIELRSAGATYAEIARTVGYKHPSAAREAVLVAIDELSMEPTAKAIMLELNRLDDYQKRATHALKSSGDLNHINLLLRLMEMRLRLMGATTEVIREVADKYNGVSASQSGAVSMTNNGSIVVVQGTSETDFVKKMMAAVGVPKQTQEEYLATLEAEKNPKTKARTIKVPSKILKRLEIKKKGGGVGGTPSTPKASIAGRNDLTGSSQLGGVVPHLGESNLPPLSTSEEIEIIDAELVEEEITD